MYHCNINQSIKVLFGQQAGPSVFILPVSFYQCIHLEKHVSKNVLTYIVGGHVKIGTTHVPLPIPLLATPQIYIHFSR